MHLSSSICSSFSEISSSLYIEFWVFFFISIIIDCGKQSPKALSLVIAWLVDSSCPWLFSLDLNVLCGDKKLSEWGGRRFDVKCQVTNSNISPQSPPPHPKFIILGGSGEQIPVRLMRERSLLHLINTVKSVLQQFSQYVVHDRNSFN